VINPPFNIHPTEYAGQALLLFSLFLNKELTRYRYPSDSTAALLSGIESVSTTYTQKYLLILRKGIYRRYPDTLHRLARRLEYN